MLRWNSASGRARSRHALRRATASATAARGAAKLEVLELRRLLAADALDPTFGSGGVALHNLGDLAVVASAIDSSGNIAVVGDAVVAQVSPAGTLNWSTPLGANFAAIDVAVDSIGRIVIAGTNSLQDFVVARFDSSDGSPDTSFATAGVYTELTLDSQEATGVAVGPNDSVLVVGNDGSANVAVLRLNSDGAPQEFVPLDKGFATFDLGTNADSAGGVTFQSNGTAVIAGRTNTDTATENLALALLEPNGAVSITVTDNGGSEGLASVAVNGSDAIYATATSSTGGFLVRYDVNGAFLGATALDGGATVGGVDTDALGNVYVAAVPLTFDVLSITRFTSAGTPDAGFGNNGTVQTATTPGAFVLTFDVNVQPNGEPVAVGLNDASPDPGDTSVALARWGDDGGGGGGNEVTAVMQGGNLVVTGTNNADDVRVALTSGGQINVLSGNTLINTFTVSGTVIINGDGGDDDITIGTEVTNDTEIHGGDGNDVIKGGGGDDLMFGDAGDDKLKARLAHDILIGGEGDDTLAGGQGRDLLFGGNGADKIAGQDDADIIVSGTTAYDGNNVALTAIQTEWVTNTPAAARTIIKSSTFAYKLAAGTIFDDLSRDTLSGGSGANWFIANLNIDKVTDLSSTSDFPPEDLAFITTP